MSSEEAIKEQAALWAARTSDADFDDWSGFTAWLEQDPAHSTAYDRVMAAVGEATELYQLGEETTAYAPQEIPLGAPTQEPVAANDDTSSPAFSGNRRWFAGGIAASIAAVVAFALMPTGPSLARYETLPGETLAIELNGGARIDLGGSTVVELSGEDQRVAKLIEGQVVFTAEGDHGEAFEVIAGGDRIIDIGTIFDVRLSADILHVEVAEGAVILNPRTTNIRLDPGQSVTRQGGEYSVGEVPTAQVGEWREGRVSFRSAGLKEVADRLTRATGIVFSAKNPGSMTLSGSVLVDPIKADPESVGPLLGLQISQTDAGWVISPS